MIHATTVDDVRDAIRSSPRVLPVAGQTKPALSSAAEGDVEAIDMTGLTGIVAFDPAELTITACAGTPLAEIRDALAAHGQHLPFDPPLADAGATLGGTVAAGVSGSGAFHRGALRDFIIGVRFVDGTGTLLRGGGQVVKNAAGFDLPKLLVGSAGRLGVMTELSLKVFPRPAFTETHAFAIEDLAEAIAAVQDVARSGLDVTALDIEPGVRMLVRTGGDPAAAGERAARLVARVAAPGVTIDDEAAFWHGISELRWVPDGHTVLRAGLAPGALPALHEALGGAPVRYANAANVAWIAWPPDRDLAPLDARLAALGLTAMRITGPAGRPLIGARPGGAFAQRVTAALDPDHRFTEL